MKLIAKSLISASLVAAFGSAFAQDAPGNGIPQPRIGPAKKLSAEECAARPAPVAGAKKDVATLRQDRYCAKLMKKSAATPASGVPMK